MFSWASPGVQLRKTARSSAKVKNESGEMKEECEASGVMDVTSHRCWAAYVAWVHTRSCAGRREERRKPTLFWPNAEQHMRSNKCGAMSIFSCGSRVFAYMGLSMSDVNTDIVHTRTRIRRDAAQKGAHAGGAIRAKVALIFSAAEVMNLGGARTSSADDMLCSGFRLSKKDQASGQRCLPFHMERTTSTQKTRLASDSWSHKKMLYR